MPKIKGNPEDFGYSKEEWDKLPRGHRWRLRHPEKSKLATATWYKQNTEYVKERARKYQLRDKYSLTEEQYQKMLQEQNYSCAICKTTTPSGKWKVFAVDHCHITNTIRGLLCNECNRGIGLLGDSISRLEAAISYLKENKRRK